MPPDLTTPDLTTPELVHAIHGQLLAVDPAATADARRVVRAVREAQPLLPHLEVRAVANAVASRSHGLGSLDPVMADPAVTEVMVNGGGPVWVERWGRLEELDLQLTNSEVALLVERILGPLGLRADRTSPVADARLPDGSRVNVVVPPLAVDGPCITIRRFGARCISLADLCPPGVAALLAWAVAARCSIVVSGGTGAGKTTSLNALAAFVPSDERIITVEDTAELRLPHVHVVRLEARPATADGVGATDIRTLVRNALRMRPDRIIVGEVRGPEAVDMLWAMNTGHDGSLSTCHANSPADALRRLEVMVLSAGLDLPLVAVRDQLSSAIDLIVQVARLADGTRRVVAGGELGHADAPERIRPLAGPTGLVALPERPARAAGALAADPEWLAVSALLAGGVAALAVALARLRPATAIGKRSPQAMEAARVPVWLSELLDVVPIRLDPGAAWRVLQWGAVIMVALAGTVVGPVGAVLALATVTAAPAASRRVVGARQARALEAQMPEALEHLATAVRAGSGLHEALASTAESTPPPLGLELRALATQVHHGAALQSALAHWGAPPHASPGTRLAATALGLAVESGGAVARSVDRVAATLRERREVQAEAQALATQAKASAAVLVVAPVVFTTFASGIEPATLTFLFKSPTGLICLCTGLLLEVLGAAWMARILRRVA